jgi:energy-coupling factor transporter ATP-binding protein EcfA2
VIERLKRETVHSFLPLETVISSVNNKIKNFGEGRICSFHKTYFEVDKELLEKELVFRSFEDQDYVYLKDVYDNERLIQKTLKELSIRPDISLRAPITLERWNELLHDPNSPIYSSNPKEYDQIISKQSEVCSKIFQKPLSVIIGAAGTGKTTIIKALIQAIELSQGKGTSFLLLAPTGKAADRLREQTKKPAATIHSFLAQRGWLNDNFSIRRSGGKQENGISTLIIDESSMLDLDLAGGFFRAINWNSIQRIIFVGDQNQLPPIGRGKLFVEIIEWLEKNGGSSIGKLSENIRQRVNALTNKGTAILDVAQLYIRGNSDEEKKLLKIKAEEIFPKISQGGEIDKDLKVVFWEDYDDLEKTIIDTFIEDMSFFSNSPCNSDTIENIWTKVVTINGIKKADFHQIITPNRGDLYGTEHINEVMQKLLHKKFLLKPGTLGSITINDKVIQFVNRPPSNPYYAYNLEKKQKEKIEVYNGEIGFVRPRFGNYKDLLKNHLKTFQVIFSRKPQYCIDFLSETQVTENIELAYAISIHKAQGSEFNHVYLIIPKKISRIMSPELLYTGLTRASQHLTLFIEKDISPLQSLFRCENSLIDRINSSIFSFQPIPLEFISRDGWYEEGKIHVTLARYMVRSKSEVIIANILHQRNIPFFYEKLLYAPDGSSYLPDFTISWRGEVYYLEHLGLLDQTDYRKKWEEKQKWYDKWFPEKLLTLSESSELSLDIEQLIDKYFPATELPEDDTLQKWKDIIKQGESTTVEFKSSLRWDYIQNNLNKELKHEVLKTICAFLNSDGGILFIGVDDQGQILGLENDYKTLGKRQDKDGFLQSIDASINEHLRRDTHANLIKEMCEIDNKEICVISVKPSNSPVFLEYGNDEEFFIRGAVSSIRMKSREQFEYIKKRFG